MAAIFDFHEIQFWNIIIKIPHQRKVTDKSWIKKKNVGQYCLTQSYPDTSKIVWRLYKNGVKTMTFFREMG